MKLVQEPVRADPLDYASSQSGASERVEDIMCSVRDNRTTAQREAALDELIELYGQLEDTDEEQVAREAEIAFLLLLRDEPDILDNADYRSFVASCIDRESFYQIEWETVEEVIMVAEVLYGFRYKDELKPDQITEYVRDLVRHALRQFERQHQPEKMFELLQRAPIPSSMMDPELVRLRNRLHLYEMRRVRRKRRFLYGWLIAQIVLVFFLFPYLFQNFENGNIQQQVEQTTGIEIKEGAATCTDETPDTQRYLCDTQLLSYTDSLYWSVITYGSIGYGDVSPVTKVGKFLAGLHGLMGVLTTGIFAGLVLNWISPRSLRP